MRNWLWVVVALTIPGFAVLVLLVRHRERLVEYQLDGSTFGHYEKSTRVLEDSWQARLLRPLIGYVGPVLAWDEGGERLGAVGVGDVPGIGDPVVRHVLTALDHCEVQVLEILEEGAGAALAENRRVAFGLSRVYQLRLYIFITFVDPSGRHAQIWFAFDRAHRLVAETARVMETGEEVIDTFVPGEVAHRVRTHGVPTVSLPPTAAPSAHPP